MANPETIGWGECDCCGKSVAVKLNRSGLAYYRCDHCGVSVQHHWKRTSDAFARQFAANSGASPAAGQGEEGAADRRESQPAPPKARPAGGLSALFGGAA